MSGSEPKTPASGSEGASRPTLRVVRGDATPEEIAVLVALLGARPAGTGDGGAPRAAQPVSAWSTPNRMLRKPLQQGPGAWAASAWR